MSAAVVLLGLVSVALVALAIYQHQSARACRRKFVTAIADRDKHKMSSDILGRELDIARADLKIEKAGTSAQRGQIAQLAERAELAEAAGEEANAANRAARGTLEANARKISTLERRNLKQSETIQELQDRLEEAKSWRISLDELIAVMIHEDRATPSGDRRWPGVNLRQVTEWITLDHRDDVLRWPKRPGAEREIEGWLDAWVAAQ